MKDANTRMSLMDLRAQSLSFTRITKEFGIAKQTLINWNRNLKEERENLKSERLKKASQETLVRYQFIEFAPILASRYWLNMLTFACTSFLLTFSNQHLNLCPNSLAIRPEAVSA